MVLSSQKIEHGSFAIMRSYGNQSSAICDRNVTHNILNSDHLIVGKKIGEKFNLSCLFMDIFRIQNRGFLRFWSWRCRRFRTKTSNKFGCSKISSSMSAMLFALIFPRAQHAKYIWHFRWTKCMATVGSAIVCDYMETALFAILCDPRSSVMVCDHMETSLKKKFEARNWK